MGRGRLDGHGAVVVGGGQMEGQTIGNGRATAQTFGREGARVLVVDRDEGSARETAEAIKAVGGEAYVHQADISVEADCGGLVQAVAATIGRVDVLNHNVGINLLGDTATVTLADWQRAFDVNLTGMWLTCKYLLPVMRAGGGGSVILISSIAGVLAGPQTVAYTTTKAAVNSLGRSLALDYAPHQVRVNVIAPGAMDTPIGIDDVARLSGLPREEVHRQHTAVVPMGHQGTGWDVANAALFLASSEAAFITGAILPVDGGSTLGRTSA